MDEWPTLNVDAYHGIAGEFVRTAEPYTESDPVALLVTFLNAFGNAVGRNAYVKVGGDHHHANLFACLVGASSRARKGTSLGIILDVFSSIDISWNDRRVNGLSSGEGVIAAVKDGRRKRARAERSASAPASPISDFGLLKASSGRFSRFSKGTETHYPRCFAMPGIVGIARPNPP